MPRRRRANHRLRVSEAEMPTADPPPLAGVDESMVEKVNEVQRLLGYRFRDPKLFQEALTHSSYPDRPSYKRLKHLGAAALNLALANCFFITNSDVGPSDLTAFRAANVSNLKYARIAVQHRLYCFIRHNSPALDSNVDDLYKVLPEIVKSIIGAVYVDCSFNVKVLWKVIRGLLDLKLPKQRKISKLKAAGVDKSMVEALDKVQQLLGYSFRDPTLLQEALTHPSYPARPCYERLEHLGDAALNLAFTNHFFTTYPEVGPGRLSDLRDENISNKKFARIAVQHRLYRFIRHKLPVHRRNAHVLADIVESVAGAVYVDCNFNVKALWEVISGLLEPIVPLSSLDGQPATALREKEPLGSAARETCSSSSGEIAATPKFSSEYLRDHNLGSSRSSKLPPAPSTSRLAQALDYHVLDRHGKSIPLSDWVIQEFNRFCVERNIQTRVSEWVDCDKTFPRVYEGSKPNVNLPSSSLKVGGSSEQKQISKLDASGEALLNFSGSESKKMSTDSSLSGVEEKEEAKHKLGMLCGRQKLVNKDGQPATTLREKEPLGSATRETGSSSSGEIAATPKFSSEYLRDHNGGSSGSSKLPPAPSSSRLAQALPEAINSYIESNIQTRVSECDDCDETFFPRVYEGSKPNVNLPSSSLKVGGSSEQKQISKLDASAEALLNFSGSEPEKMSTDSSLSGVEEKEEAKHKLGNLCGWQKLVINKFWRAVVGIKLVKFVMSVVYAMCLILIFFSIVVNHVSVN